ncbi:MAG: S41 family peptidase [Candidatus Cloacimonetes bacterium]|nr:S41 family peptidase [Candidatus Cloacimonadota bacterium]
MQKFIFTLFFALTISALSAYEPFYVDDPAISPDGQSVLFVYMNNIWEVPFEGGVARRLTATNDRISRPAYSPCDNWISFQSDREGINKIFLMPRNGGVARKISDEDINFSEWYPDSSAILGIMRSPGELGSYVKLELGGHRPLEILGITGSFATISDEGTKIVFDRRGLAFRPAYQGTHNGDLWLYDINTEEFTRLTDTPLTERYPKFSRKHKDRLYYVASDGKHFQLFYMDDFDITTQTQLTFFTDWSARDISVSSSVDRVVFEYFKEIWSYDPATEQVRKIPIAIWEDNFPNPIVHQRFESELTSFFVSQNQELLVFSHRYDLFAVPIRGGLVRQLTFDQAGIQDFVIMNDNETIYFAKNIKGIPRLHRLNIRNPQNIEQISWSDDKYIESLRINHAGEMIIRYDKSIERNIFAKMDRNGNFTDTFPDDIVGNYIETSSEKGKTLYSSIDLSRWVRTLKIKDLRTNTVQDLFKTTRNIGTMVFSEDENKLFFSYNGNINIVSLVNEWQKNEDHWDRIIPRGASQDVQNPIATAEWDINFDNFQLRNRVLVDEPGWLQPVFASRDSTLYYFNTNNGNTVLKSIKFDGTKKEDVFNTRGNVNNFQLTQDQSAIYYILNSRLHKLTLRSKQSNQIEFDYSYTFNVEKLNKDVFEHVWGRFGHNFYDPNMHGQDWEEIYELFEPHIHEIRDVNILQRFIDEMIGRVNASHTGFTPRTDGRVNLFTPAFAGFIPDYRSRLPIGIRVKKIYFGSELHQKYNITENDIILEINGQSINSTTAISPLLLNQLGKDISFRIQTSRGVVNALVKGISAADQSQLRYEDMVLSNFQTVKELTNNRIGYIHIQRMNQSSLRRFEQDIWAINANTDGLVIDIRGNGGGSIRHDLMDIITRPARAYTYNRTWGIEPYPTPSNIYQNPIVLLIDEDSYSDAEIFGTLFRDFNIGYVIGMPTSGSVIGTRPWPLFDGSSMRMPVSGWFRLNWENMELFPTIPDILVPRLPEHHISGDDPQLQRAIDVLFELMGD